MATDQPLEPPAPRGRTIGEEPKPRVLFSWEGPARDRVAAVLAIHAPTVRAIDALGDVRQDNYDVLVTDRLDRLVGDEAVRAGAKGPEEHLFVISFAPPMNEGATWGQADLCHGKSYLGVDWKARFLSKAVEMPSDLLPAAQDLVTDDLLPTVLSRDPTSTSQRRSGVTGRFSLPAALHQRGAAAGEGQNR